MDNVDHILRNVLAPEMRQFSFSRRSRTMIRSNGNVDAHTVQLNSGILREISSLEIILNVIPRWERTREMDRGSSGFYLTRLEVRLRGLSRTASRRSSGPMIRRRVNIGSWQIRMSTRFPPNSGIAFTVNGCHGLRNSTIIRSGRVPCPTQG